VKYCAITSSFKERRSKAATFLKATIIRERSLISVKSLIFVLVVKHP